MNRALSRAVPICLVLGLGACGDDPSATSEPQQPTTTPVTAVEAFPSGDEPVAIDAGTYLVEGAEAGESVPTYTVTVPDGWTADSSSDLKKNAATPQGISVAPWGVIEDIGVYPDACHGELGDPGPAPTSAAELVSALRAQKSGPRVEDPVATTVGGLQATQIDLDYPDREASENCRIGTGQLQVWGTYFVFFPNHSASAYVVDVAGTQQVFLVETADGASAADRAEARSILDSMRFDVE